MGSADTIDPSRAVETFLAGIGPTVARIVLLSSFGVDQAPEDDPLRRTELLVETARVPATILRPTAFMQNFRRTTGPGCTRASATTAGSPCRAPPPG